MYVDPSVLFTPINGRRCAFFATKIVDPVVEDDGLSLRTEGETVPNEDYDAHIMKKKAIGAKKPGGNAAEL